MTDTLITATSDLTERPLTLNPTADTLAIAPAGPSEVEGLERGVFYPLSKRFLDVSLSLFLLVLLLPLLAVLGALVKWQDGGPALFSQWRVGKDGKRFRFYKFRSMHTGAEAQRSLLDHLNRHGDAAITFKIEDDPRVTELGRVMRRTSLDELPQLWNVLLGDMSLVGPRPAVCSEVDSYSAADRCRLAVRPGLTCTWQVSGRSEIPFRQQVEMDVAYIRERSLMLDLWLLVRTIPAVFSRRGAC